jgi:hypothetical protein
MYFLRLGFALRVISFRMENGRMKLYKHTPSFFMIDLICWIGEFVLILSNIYKIAFTSSSAADIVFAVGIVSLCLMFSGCHLNVVSIEEKFITVINTYLFNEGLGEVYHPLYNTYTYPFFLLTKYKCIITTSALAGGILVL